MEKTARTTMDFEYEGKPYSLYYTADTISKMEERGYNFANTEARLLSYPTALFIGAFIANHDDVPEEKRIEIFHELCAKESEDESALDIATILSAMAIEGIAEIRSHKGNVKWKVNR